MMIKMVTIILIVITLTVKNNDENNDTNNNYNDSYNDENGENKKMKYEGLTARIFLHEMDHMMGIDFTQRASKLVLDRGIKARDKKIKKLIKEGKLKLPDVA